jgi:hypothetical protein
MRGPFFLKSVKIFVLIVCAVAGLPTAAESLGKTVGSATKIRLATPAASLSYLPIMWRSRTVSSPKAF